MSPLKTERKSVLSAICLTGGGAYCSCFELKRRNREETHPTSEEYAKLHTKVQDLNPRLSGCVSSNYSASLRDRANAFEEVSCYERQILSSH